MGAVCGASVGARRNGLNLEIRPTVADRKPLWGGGEKAAGVSMGGETEVVVVSAFDGWGGGEIACGGVISCSWDSVMSEVLKLGC